MSNKYKAMIGLIEKQKKLPWIIFFLLIHVQNPGGNDGTEGSESEEKAMVGLGSEKKLF